MTSPVEVRPLRVRFKASLPVGARSVAADVVAEVHELSGPGSGWGTVVVSFPVEGVGPVEGCERSGVLAAASAAVRLGWSELCGMVAELFGLAGVVVVSVSVEPVSTMVRPAVGPQSARQSAAESVAIIRAQWREVGPGPKAGAPGGWCGESDDGGDPDADPLGAHVDSLFRSLGVRRGDSGEPS